MMLLVVAGALAADLRVVLREDQDAFHGAYPHVRAVDAAGRTADLTMDDGGAPPDARAGDHVWTGLVRTLGDGPYALSLSDGGDRLVWTGTFTGKGGVVALAAAPAGVLTELASDALPVAEPGAAPPPGPPTTAGPTVPVASLPTAAPSAPAAPPSSATTAAWVLVVALAGWLLAGVRRGRPVLLAPAPGSPPAPLPPGVHGVDADPDAVVRALAGPRRVVTLGFLPDGPHPEGSVFPLAPGPVPDDELAAVLRHLERTGAPLVVVGRGPSPPAVRGVPVVWVGHTPPTLELGPSGLRLR